MRVYRLVGQDFFGAIVCACVWNEFMLRIFSLELAQTPRVVCLSHRTNGSTTADINYLQNILHIMRHEWRGRQINRHPQPRSNRIFGVVVISNRASSSRPVIHLEVDDSDKSLGVRAV